MTPRLTAAALRRAAAAGVSAVSLSLDGAHPATHDTFRGVPGAFAATARAAADVRAAGCALRVHTTVTRASLPELPALAELAAAWGAETWAIFFLVPTGRARLAMQITPAECETTLRWLVTLADSAPFRVKTTEAPHYRRVTLEVRAARAGRAVAEVARGGRSGLGRFVPGLNDGRGIAFVSHTGQVCPSGFLPLSAGNVRRRPVSACYRESGLFRSLRDPSRLRGPCGRCPFRVVCGGSRARAFAATGCPLDTDPLCAYEPPAGGSPEAAA